MTQWHELINGDPVGFWVRVGTIGTGALCLIMGGAELVRVWVRLTFDMRMRRIALLTLIAAGVYGTTEALLTGIPPATRTYVVAIAFLWALIGYLVPDDQQAFPVRLPPRLAPRTPRARMRDDGVEHHDNTDDPEDPSIPSDQEDDTR